MLSTFAYYTHSHDRDSHVVSAYKFMIYSFLETYLHRTEDYTPNQNMSVFFFVDAKLDISFLAFSLSSTHDICYFFSLGFL